MRGIRHCWGSSHGHGTGLAVVLVGAADAGVLLDLHGPHAPDGLFALDALLFRGLKDLLVFYTELTSLDIEAIEGSDDGICVYGLAEIGKGQAAEGTLLVKMIVERIRGRDRQGGLGGDY